MIDYADLNSIDAIIAQIKRLTQESEQKKLERDNVLKIAHRLQNETTQLEHDLDVMYKKFKDMINETIVVYK